MAITTKPSAQDLASLLQLGDSSFPAGGYAHSYALEEIVREGIVTGEESLRSFLMARVSPLLAHLELPLIREAHTAADREDWEDLLAIDELAAALKPARELREASLQTGRRRLAMLVEARPTPLLCQLHKAADHNPRIGHHAVVWAAACAELSSSTALTSAYYQAIAGYCQAAPKLMRIGQAAIQRVLTACLSGVEAAIDTASAVSRDEIGWFDPSFDIAAMHHETANERLFIS